MMLPILIAVSVAPGSYFFSAMAGPAPARTASAMDANQTMLRCVIEPSLLCAGVVAGLARSLGLKREPSPARSRPVRHRRRLLAQNCRPDFAGWNDGRHL